MFYTGSVTKISFLDFLVQAKYLRSDSARSIRQRYTDETILDGLEHEGFDLYLAKQLKEFYDQVDYIDLNVIQAEMKPVLSEDMMRQYKIYVIEVTQEKVVLGMVNPFDSQTVDLIANKLGSYIFPVLISKASLHSLLSASSGSMNQEKIDNIIVELAAEISNIEVDNIVEDTGKSDDFKSAAVRLIHNIIMDAYYHGVSDVHIEASGDSLRIRRRIDGRLNEYVVKDGQVGGYLFRRLRIMAGLDITEGFLPQDGRISIVEKGKAINTRLSIIKTKNGQSAVIRILGDVEAYSNLDKVIADKEVISAIRDVIHKPSGMVLVTGPTGSGKTTTQYCALMEINDITRKLISLEDPVEAELDGVNQIEINEELGIDFSSMLASILRQDPDVIMIGEIRDQNTANISMRAAITGHVVMATLHTSDVLTTINRLMNLGMDGYMVASALCLILSQRLLKRICTHCITDYTVTEKDINVLSKKNITKKQIQSKKLKAGSGCQHCKGTGHHDRIGVFEYLVCDEHLMDVLSAGDFIQFKKMAEKKLQGKLFFDKALTLASEGIISLDQALIFVHE
jgi:MSHA biogenesis protein MshE